MKWRKNHAFSDVFECIVYLLRQETPASNLNIVIMVMPWSQVDNSIKATLSTVGIQYFHNWSELSWNFDFISLNSFKNFNVFTIRKLVIPNVSNLRRNVKIITSSYLAGSSTLTLGSVNSLTGVDVNLMLTISELLRSASMHVTLKVRLIYFSHKCPLKVSFEHQVLRLSH